MLCSFVSDAGVLSSPTTAVTANPVTTNMITVLITAFALRAAVKDAPALAQQIKAAVEAC